MEIEFEWDSGKEAANRRKHGLSFHEAASVFEDPLSWTFPDPDHSVGEHRWLTIGVSSSGKVIVISHADRGRRTRVISARAATRYERRDYEEG